ncbi:MAG: NADPH-dependent ferric siderophore reductase [Candidatus Azotimanducaceae bacterium]|jgi:NADPH-dependent ferric siderophore reductase
MAKPDDAKGYAIIQVSSVEDKQSLNVPQGIELQWFVGDRPENASGFIRTIRQQPWLDGTPYPWFAGEFETMRRVRKYFRDDKKINRKQMYVSSYWKHGDTDEGMKQAKRLDPDA